MHQVEQYAARYISLWRHLENLHYDLTDLQESQHRAEHDERLLLQVIEDVQGIPETSIVKQSVATSKLVKSTTSLTEQVQLDSHF